MTNPVYFCYSSTAGVLEAAKPGAIFIPDQHRLNPIYQEARALGAEVYPYLDMVEDHVRGALDREFREYAWNGGPVELWGNNRASWYPLLNTRVGSAYVKRTVDYIAEKFMPHFDGIMLDVVGGQLHAKARWAEWPESEQLEWQEGKLDFVRQLDAARRAIKPWFNIQTVNIWHEDKRGLAHVDGFCVEKPAPGLGLFYRNLVTAPCSYLGRRRVIVLARTLAEAQAYAQVPGVTHVTAVDTSLGQTYLTLTPAVVEPQDNRLAEAQAMQQWLHQNASGAEQVAQLETQLAELLDELTESQGTVSQQAAQLNEATEAKRLLAERADALTTKIRSISEHVQREAEGVQ